MPRRPRAFPRAGCQACPHPRTLHRFTGEWPACQAPACGCRGYLPRARQQHEKAVQTACKQYLRLRGAEIWDTSQPFRAAITPGLPDLLVFLPGRGLVFIECKAPGGRLSAAQQRFRAACQAAGVPYLVVTAAADLAAQLARLEAGGAA